MKVSIIVPTYNRNEKLRLLIDSICKLPIKAELEVLIVANISDLVTQQICRSFENQLDIKYLCANKVGVNSARNLGLASVRNNICFFVDDDCEFSDATWYYELINSFSLSMVSGVGGFYKPKSKMSYAGAIYWTKITAWLLRYADTQSDACLRLVGGCMAFRKDRLALNTFSENLIFGGTETEFVLRLNLQNKLLVLNRKIWLLHDFNISIFELLKKVVRQARFHHSMKGTDHRVFASQKRNFQKIESILLNRLYRKYNPTLLKFVLITYKFAFFLGRFK